jgi:hypothetical protein
MLATPSPEPSPGVLQPTRYAADPIRLLRLDHAALVSLPRPLHPALQGVRRFVEALLTLSPAAARRLGTLRPEVWAATLARRDDAPIVGLGWLAGDATEVIAAPGHAHDDVIRQLMDALLDAARRRRLAALTARLSGPPDLAVALAGLDARIVARGDDALFLHVDLTPSLGD